MRTIKTLARIHLTMSDTPPGLTIECPETGCPHKGRPNDLLRHRRDAHDLDQATIGDNIALKYCPHCGATDIITLPGSERGKVCLSCFDCGKHFWFAH